MAALAPVLIALIGFLFGQKYLDRLIPDPKAPPANAYQYPQPGSTAPVVVGDKHPTFGDTANDLANNPLSIWGFAAMGFVAVFLIAQLRAAGHEVGGAFADTTEALSNPEGAVQVKHHASPFKKRKGR
ncbi:MAG TPA: hypothetical protein VHN99_08385 [Deinococcales bacterium]|nr:hypothetical protein [Deinococcales bacterium]